MQTRQTILDTIRDHKNKIQKFGVKNVGLYGSYVKDQQTSHSDIDILIDFDPEFEKFDNYMALYDFLENLFQGEKIEVVTKSGLSPYIGTKILNEVVYA